MPGPFLDAGRAEDGRTEEYRGDEGVVSDVTEFVRRVKKSGREGVDVMAGVEEGAVSEELVKIAKLERLLALFFFDEGQDGSKWSQIGNCGGR